MKACWMVIKYIVCNNPPYRWLLILVKAGLIQLFWRRTGLIITKKIFNGKFIFLFPKCQVSSMFLYTDIPDKREILILRKVADKTTVFLDIGANIGSYSIMLADKVSRTIAFEPHPVSAKRCRLNYLLNDMDVNDVVQMALDNKSLTVIFSDYDESSTENRIITKGKGIKVNTITVDEYVKKNKFNKSVNYLLKIDVEGYEKEVLEGAKYFMENYKIKGVLFECFDNNSKIFDWLSSYGYKLKRISENNYWAQKN